MKIIDEKGKLFGLINVIDLLVIAVVISVGGTFVCHSVEITGNRIQARAEQKIEDKRTEQINDLHNRLRQAQAKNERVQRQIEKFLKEHPRYRRWFP